MAQTQNLLSGTLDTVLSTELNSLASGSLALGSEITLTNQNYADAEVELFLNTMTAPTANTAILVWFLRAVDATNYEDGGTSVTPLRSPDVFFTLRASTTTRITKRCKLPPGKFKVLLKSDSIGQALAASGNTLKIKPLTNQFV